MSYTPRPNTSRDRLARAEQKIRELSTTRSLRSATIGEGGITVQDGGGITITDQGILEVDDGGIIIARHLNGQRAFFVGPSQDLASYAFLVENPDGWGMIRYYTLASGDSFVYLGHEIGRPNITGWGDQVYFDSTDNMFLYSDQGLDIRVGNVVNMTLGNGGSFNIYDDRPGQLARISRTGASNAATAYKGGDGLGCTIKMQNNFEFHFLDGSENVYLPIYAGTYHDQSSRRLKTDLGYYEEDALSVVSSVPIRRWSYLNAPSTDGDGDENQIESGEAPQEQIGPFAEDVTSDMGDPDNPDPEKRSVQINGSLWTLWKAVQELSAKVDEQQKTIDALTEQLKGEPA